MNKQQISTSFQINCCDCHPMVATATLNIEKNEEGNWSWSVDRIERVFLLVGGKLEVDITGQVLEDKETKRKIAKAVAEHDGVQEALASVDAFLEGPGRFIKEKIQEEFQKRSHHQREGEEVLRDLFSKSDDDETAR